MISNVSGRHNRHNNLCASGSVGGARPCQGRGRGFESRLALFLYTKGILKGYLLYINESCRTRTFEVSALLRSVQNRHPPDVVHRLALNQKEVRTDIYARVLPDSNGSYLHSTSVGANGSPLDFQHPVSRNEGFRRTRTVRIFVPLRSVQDCVFLVL